MQCLAWDKSLTLDNYPQLHSPDPKSAFCWPHGPYSLIELKLRGFVPSSCLSPDGHLHLLRVTRNDELSLKLTETGVTFLGKRNAETNKYELIGQFKKRYTGAESCAVDRDGRIWLDAKELEYHSKNPKPKPKKKKVGVPPNLQISSDQLLSELAISENLTDSENLSLNIAESSKKPRKKAYTVHKSRVRQRILAYLNTQKGKKHLFFWSVSFPAHTPDDTCYQAFNTWLTSLRQRKMLKEYLWIAERQTGDRITDGREPTNTLHFHIAIPHYLDVHKANAMMRGTLKNLAKQGLMPGGICSKEGKKVHHSFTASIAKYNGVDIDKNRKTGRVINFAIKKGAATLANYLTKYVTKNDEEFDHLAWHNSRGFTCLFTGITCTMAEFTRMGFGGYLNRCRVFEMNFATFIPWLFGPPKIITDHLFQINSLIQQYQDG